MDRILCIFVIVAAASVTGNTRPFLYQAIVNESLIVAFTENAKTDNLTIFLLKFHKVSKNINIVAPSTNRLIH